MATLAFTVFPTADKAVSAVKAAGGTKAAVAPLQWNPSRHLLSRFGFGPWGPQTVTNVEKWFAAQVQLGTTSGGYRGVPALAAAYPYLALPIAQTRMQLKAEGNEWGGTSMDQLTRATLALQAWSPAQLYESVVDFFSNRLNAANYASGLQSMRTSYDRDVIRANAFGRYRDMLLAAAKHPALLYYLAADDSTFVAPNENFGRELLELHTVGRAAGYTQDDVVASARMLTGRGVDNRFSDYMWSNGAHTPGPLSILGFSSANDSVAKGEEAGDAYVSYLATHPSTAASLARALCVRFVSDTPSADLVDAVAAAYLANDTAIVPMLQTIVRSSEFWYSRGAKLRRPLENVIGTVRILQLQAKSLDPALQTLAYMTQTVGQRPLACPAPPGYADVATPWLAAGAFLRLWQYQLGLVRDGWGGQFTTADSAYLYGGSAPATTASALDAVATTLLGVTLNPTEQAAMLDYLGESPGLAISRSRLSTGQLPDAAGMLLHSAHHHLR